MAKKTNVKLGKTKKTTDEIIADAVARQKDWRANRSRHASKFLRKLNLFAVTSEKAAESKDSVKKEKTYIKVAKQDNDRKPGIASYWFPVLCVVLVVAIAIWVGFFRSSAPQSEVVGVPEPIVKPVKPEAEKLLPSFDVARIEKDGTIVIAGRYLPETAVSIVMNNKVVATEMTSKRGEFVYSPKAALKPGNYTLYLVGADEVESASKIFLFISPKGYKNSMSLLFSKDGSTLMQAPKLVDGDLVVSKIDYLESGRIVVTGSGIPLLRVSMTLNGEYLGFAKVSSHRHFGLGVDVEKLVPGNVYDLVIRLHDGDGRSVSTVAHSFTMPKMTGPEDTFYTVRRGDCLWIIARNFLRKGVLFSIIAEKNDIKNPDLIFPKQKLVIPVGAE